MRKKMSVVLCAIMMAGVMVVPLPVQAENVTAAESTTTASMATERTSETRAIQTSKADTDSLTAVTKYVKGKINIPKTLTEFEYYYNAGSGSGQTGIWNLNWSDKDGNESIRVKCSEDKNIISYYNNKDTEKSHTKPLYTRKALKSKADAFIKKAAPSLVGSLSYQEKEGYNRLNGVYTYSYSRVENKIAMPDNSVAITVNYETGEVESFETDWIYDAKLPSGGAKLTKDEAAKKLAQEMKMELVYKNSYKNSTPKAFLVYQPNKAYLSIDAITGKVYTARSEWRNEGATEDSMAAGGAQNKKDSNTALTDKEIESISKLKDLITQDKAISIIRGQKDLYLSEDCKSVNASLITGYRSDSKAEVPYYWNLTFSTGKEEASEDDGSYQPYARAVVDAKTGRILSFYATMPDYYNTTQDKWSNVSVKYNLKESQALLETFLKSQVPDYFKNAKINTSRNDYVIGYKGDSTVYGGYTYAYDRTKDGIPYPDNGLSGSVDGITGKIYEYSLNWEDATVFESAKNAMSADKAMDQYLAKDGYGLMYEVNTVKSTNGVEYQIRLVYRPDVTPAFISPFSGKQLDYDGEEYQANAGVFTYTDLGSSKYKNDILLLADLGIGFEGGKFQPNRKMTMGEFQDIMKDITYQSSATSLTAKQKAKTLTRMDAVKAMIQTAGMEKAAKLPKIYKTSFKDQSKIPSADLGYAALAQGLKLVSGTKFEPTATVTRGEAAEMIIKLLKADF